MRLARRTTEQEEDARLLAACLVGDEAAWSVLVERYSRLVFSIALKSGLNEDDAADVVQNVFAIVLRRLETLQQADRFSAWLITTTHRESWRLRKMQRESKLPDGFDSFDEEAAADAQIVAWEHAVLTHKALRRLSGSCQRLLELLFLQSDQPDYKTIAGELGIAIGSIGPIRARCLKRLKSALAEYGIVDANR